jgi:WD40 repeat protein
VWDCATGVPRIDENLSGQFYQEEEETGVFYHPDSLAFTPDGRHLAVGYSSGRDETFVRIWSCESGSERKLASPRVATKRFEEQNPLVLGNEWIAIVGKEEGSVRLEPFGEATLPPKARDFSVVGEVKGLAASRDSIHLAAVVGFDPESPKSRSRPRPPHTGTLSIWDTSTGELTHTMDRNEVIGSGWIKNPLVSRSAHGDRLILIDPGRYRCSFLDFRDDSPAANFSIRMPRIEMAGDKGLPVGTTIQPSLDYRRLLLTSPEKFDSWDMDVGIPVMVPPSSYGYPSEQAAPPLLEQAEGTRATAAFQFPCNQVMATAVRDDEKLLAAIDRNGAILCWKLPVAASGEVIGTLSPEDLAKPISHLQFAPDKKTITCSSVDWAKEGAKRKLGYWPVAPGAKHLWNQAADSVPSLYSRSSLAMNPMSGLLALSCNVYSNELQLLDLANGRPFPSPGIHGADMTGFTRNGSLVFAGQTKDGYETGIISPDMLRKAADDSSTLPPRFPSSGTAIALCANPVYLVVRPSGDSTANKRLRSIARTSDGSRITPLLEFPNEAQTVMAQAMFTQATDFQVASNKLKIGLEGGAMFEMPLQKLSGDESCLVDLNHVSPQTPTSTTLKSEHLLYPPDGKSVLTIGPIVCWWELATGEAMAQRFPHESMVVGATLSEDGRYLLTGTEEGVIRRWPISLQSAGEREWLPQLGEALTGLDFSKTPPMPLSQEDFLKIREKVVNQLRAAAAEGDACAGELLKHFQR